MSKSKVCLHHWTSAQHDCWHAITFTASSFLHRHSAKSTSTRRKKTLIYCPVHHHCGLYLPWNFEKQMVPCRTVMQLARKLRTDLVLVSLIKFVQHAMGIKFLCTATEQFYTVHESEPWTKICYYHSTVNSSTISRAYISNFKPTMSEDPRPRPRLKGGRLTYAMLVSV